MTEFKTTSCFISLTLHKDLNIKNVTVPSRHLVLILFDSIYLFIFFLLHTYNYCGNYLFVEQISSPDVQHHDFQWSKGSFFKKKPKDCCKLRVGLSVNSRCTHSHTHWLGCVFLYVVMKCSGAKRPYLALRCELTPSSYEGGNDLKHLDTMSILEKQKWSRRNKLLTIRRCI